MENSKVLFWSDLKKKKKTSKLLPQILDQSFYSALLF